MNSALLLGYDYSDDAEDDFGWLKAEVRTPRFSGRNGMWVQSQDILDFAVSLSAYPVSAAEPLVGDWGFCEGDVYTPVIKIVIKPKALIGALVVNVSLVDFYEPANRCDVSLDADYPSLGRFQADIERMMHTRAGSALLECSSTAA